MATRPNEKGGAAAPPVSALISLLTGSSICTAAEPTLSDERKRAAWDAAEKAWHDANRRVESARALLVVIKTKSANALYEAAWRQLLSAADRLIRTPMPPGTRRDMERAHYWKRSAVRRCRYSIKNDDWKEILAADKALIPPPQPRKGAAHG